MNGSCSAGKQQKGEFNVLRTTKRKLAADEFAVETEWSTKCHTDYGCFVNYPLRTDLVLMSVMSVAWNK
jgi:hypothetical protein